MSYIVYIWLLFMLYVDLYALKSRFSIKIIKWFIKSCKEILNGF